MILRIAYNAVNVITFPCSTVADQFGEGSFGVVFDG